MVGGVSFHDWMIAYVYVAESPYFAKTGSDGIAVLSNVPAGSYSVRLWHPRLEGTEEATKQSVVMSSEVVKVAWDINLTPDFRVRRAITSRGRGY